MKIRKSEITTTQESQESQNTPKSSKSGGTSPRTARTSADSVEMSSETSTRRELTTDEQAKAPRLDPENYASLLSGTDPRAAIEGSRTFGKQRQSPQHGSSTLPNGQSLSRTDLSQYNVQTTGAPPMLKDSIGQLGSRGEQLRSYGGNASDKMNIQNSFNDDMKRQEAARAAMGSNQDGLIDGIVDVLSGSPKLFKTIEETIEHFEKNSPEEKEFQEAKAAHEKREAEKREIQKTGQLPLEPLVGPSKTGGGVKDPGPDVDGTHGGSGYGGLIGPQIDGLFTGGQILQGITGRGPGGGEVVNPSREDSGGGQGSFDDHGAFKARLGYDNSHYLIGQPAGPEEERGFNGLSGVDPSDPMGGGVSDADWTGPTRTEEPGHVRTTPTGGDGQLSHLINNEDDDDRK